MQKSRIPTFALNKWVKGRFYLHKEAQNAQNAQTPLILKILFAQRGIYYTTFKNSFCTKRKLLLYRLKILFAQREI